MIVSSSKKLTFEPVTVTLTFTTQENLDQFAELIGATCENKLEGSIQLYKTLKELGALKTFE